MLKFVRTHRSGDQRSANVTVAATTTPKYSTGCTQTEESNGVNYPSRVEYETALQMLDEENRRLYEERRIERQLRRIRMYRAMKQRQLSLEITRNRLHLAEIYRRSSNHRHVTQVDSKSEPKDGRIISNKGKTS
ncbi:hypothetical protein AB6A40_000239 [Gnathostoma spinigerum]|uniref:Uncharacterized protein n=1 Tax=Gnathostoma spinigerum TaxID=75299 RepID=A0ABD6EB54_9BILA